MRHRRPAPPPSFTPHDPNEEAKGASGVPRRWVGGEAARLRLLVRLDTLDTETIRQVVDPFDASVHTIDGRSLTEDEADLLATCTPSDLQVVIDLLTQECTLASELVEVAAALADMVQPYLGEGEDEAEAMSHMPLHELGEARRLRDRRRELERVLGLAQN